MPVCARYAIIDVADKYASLLFCRFIDAADARRRYASPDVIIFITLPLDDAADADAALMPSRHYFRRHYLPRRLRFSMLPP